MRASFLGCKPFAPVGQADWGRPLQPPSVRPLVRSAPRFVTPPVRSGPAPRWARPNGGNGFRARAPIANQLQTPPALCRSGESGSLAIHSLNIANLLIAELFEHRWTATQRKTACFASMRRNISLHFQTRFLPYPLARYPAG